MKVAVFDSRDWEANMGRKILYVVGGVIVLLLLALVILPFVINVNQFRPQIEAAADSALNRKVTIGNIALSLLSGGVSVQDISVSDDPAFGASPFLTAKSVSVGVELMPLIFSRALHVTGLTINEPEVSLVRSPSGTWNFSTLGAASAKTQPASAPSQNTGADASVSVQKLEIANGKILIGDAGSATKHEYDGVNLDASDLSYTTQFPFQLSATTPGNGSLKLTGKAGPLNQTDAQQTPVEASLEIKDFDVVTSGFINPSSGIAGMLTFTGSLNSDGKTVNSKGKIEASKVQLVAGGSPAKKALDVDYDTDYVLKTQAGTLKQGDVHIGAALAHLTGTYNTSGQTAAIQMKLDGQNMPAADLEAMLPALGVTLPSGASLQSGNLSANLAIAGPVDRLVTTGHVDLADGKLAGFDLGSKLGALSSFAGVPKGSDTVIQTLSSDVRVAPDGIRTDNLNLVVPAIGSMTGSGTVSPKQELDYKMVAKLSNTASPLGGIAKLASAGSSTGGIPFKIQGTTSNPSFIPDLAGMTSGLTKGLATAPTQLPGVQNLGGAIGGLFGKKKNP
jgi:AsmA protein